MRTRLSRIMDSFARAVGHTFTEVYGVKNSPRAVLIVAHEGQKDSIDLPRKQMIPIDRAVDSLRGAQCPIVFDHYALVALSGEIDKQINDLEAERERYKKALEEIGRDCHQYCLTNRPHHYPPSFEECKSERCVAVKSALSVKERKAT